MTAKVVLEFLADIRRRYPPEVTVYIVMDNLSAHWTADIRQWAINNNVGLLPTPTNASHLNRIECHFWAYVEFVINGSDYGDWTEFQGNPSLHPSPQPRPPRSPQPPTRSPSQGRLTTITGGTMCAAPLVPRQRTFDAAPSAVRVTGASHQGNLCGSPRLMTSTGCAAGGLLSQD